VLLKDIQKRRRNCAEIKSAISGRVLFDDLIVLCCVISQDDSGKSFKIVIFVANILVTVLMIAMVVALVTVDVESDAFSDITVFGTLVSDCTCSVLNVMNQFENRDLSASFPLRFMFWISGDHFCSLDATQLNECYS